ncbi:MULTISPECIES: hypothetical protein [Rhizobium]|uniref:hypothetical protein n=1 Tax=Rhizobium TaxID=379 RepID=UPI000F4E5F1A|nr:MULTISPECIES: hypothetical protein [Rhizobium]
MYVIALVGIESSVAVTASKPDLDAMIHAARDGTGATAISVAASVFLVILALLWWFLPLIRWRGRMFYDRFAGCEVRRS